MLTIFSPPQLFSEPWPVVLIHFSILSCFDFPEREAYSSPMNPVPTSHPPCFPLGKILIDHNGQRLLVFHIFIPPLTIDFFFFLSEETAVPPAIHFPHSLVMLSACGAYGLHLLPFFDTTEVPVSSSLRFSIFFCTSTTPLTTTVSPYPPPIRRTFSQKCFFLFP